MRNNVTASGLQYNPRFRETSRGELRKKGKTVNDASWKNLKGISSYSKQPSSRKPSPRRAPLTQRASRLNSGILSPRVPNQPPQQSVFLRTKANDQCRDNQPN